MNPELEIVDLVEQAIIADLSLDPTLAQWLPHEREYVGAKAGDDELLEEEQLYTITVSAEDRGNFNDYAGIQLVAVTIDVQRNVADPTDPKGLAKLCSLIASRLPATQEADKSRHQAFSNNRLQVMGIMANEVERRSEQDLTRERSVARQFVCLQLA